jgi:hypothetical protein
MGSEYSDSLSVISAAWSFVQVPEDSYFGDAIRIMPSMFLLVSESVQAVYRRESKGASDAHPSLIDGINWVCREAYSIFLVLWDEITKSSLITDGSYILGHNYVFYKIILKNACLVSEKSDFESSDKLQVLHRLPPPSWENLELISRSNSVQSPIFLKPSLN